MDKPFHLTGIPDVIHQNYKNYKVYRFLRSLLGPGTFERLFISPNFVTTIS